MIHTTQECQIGDNAYYLNMEWLYNEYINNHKSSPTIANECKCHPNTILHHLHNFGIKVRTIKEARKIQYWGVCGEQNGMYGRCGKDNPRWLGGISPERQGFYASPEWADVVKRVWKKDKATCVRCGVYKTNDVQMHIHHVITFAVEDMRCELDNLMLTCKKCHNWIHSKKNIYEYFIAHPIRRNLKWCILHRHTR